MKAIAITEHGGPEVLKLVERPLPEPRPFEVRIRVRATAINRADLMQRAGHYPSPPGVPADIPGLEYAGDVDALGEGTTRWKIGDRVFGLVGGGAYAQAVTAHEEVVSPMPLGLSYEEAAAIPEAFITAYDAMVTQGGLTAGEIALVHAAASGVGTAAVQIAKAIGASAIGTVRTADKALRVEALGGSCICVQNAQFAKEIQSRTNGRGADVVLDLVGGPYVSENLAAIREQGRIVLVGLVGGRETPLDLGLLLRKRALLKGTMLRSRGLGEKIQIAQLLTHQLTPLFTRRLLKPIVDRVLPLAQAAEAHKLVASNETFGKVVLSIG